MALRDLLTALEGEAAAEHEMAQRELRRRAAEILADGRQRAAKAREEAVAAAQATAGQEAQRIVAAAHATARRTLQTARDDALEEVYVRVRKRLSELPGTASGAATAVACIDEALAALPQAITLRVHPADVAILPDGLSATMVGDLTTGGAVAEDADGRYIDNTYRTRLSNIWPEIRAGLSGPWDDK
jgi:vacuolar-type H+-ATPase subunit E/Vma4